MTVCVSSVTCYRFGECGHVGKKEYTSGAATIRAQHTATRHAEGLNTKMMQRKLLKDKKTQRMNKPLCLKSVITFHLTILKKKLMVDCGATSHIIIEKHKFTRFDESFDLKKCYTELADGSRKNNVALKCGDVEVYLQDSQGRCSVDALFISTYPQAVFSVTAATADDAKVMFKKRGKMSSVPKSEVYFTSRNMRECII